MIDLGCVRNEDTAVSGGWCCRQRVHIDLLLPVSWPSNGVWKWQRWKVADGGVNLTKWAVTARPQDSSEWFSSVNIYYRGSISNDCSSLICTWWLLMTFITAVSAQVQAQQDTIIRPRPQAFARKQQELKGLWKCTPCFSLCLKQEQHNSYNI